MTSKKTSYIQRGKESVCKPETWCSYWPSQVEGCRTACKLRHLPHKRKRTLKSSFLYPLKQAPFLTDDGGRRVEIISRQARSADRMLLSQCSLSFFLSTLTVNVRPVVIGRFSSLSPEWESVSVFHTFTYYSFPLLFCISIFIQQDFHDIHINTIFFNFFNFYIFLFSIVLC